jgi:hypothetical protein
MEVNMMHSSYDWSDSEQWQFFPAHLEELPEGLIEDEI